MKFWAVLLVLLIGVPLLRAEDAKPAAASRVLVVSIDGCRPDVALRADMPNLRGLMARGSFTFWANTTDVAITLPSHVSMMTGVKPEKHGIHYNDDKAGNTPEYPEVPTLFELAKKQGHTTAVAAGKHKFKIFDHDNALDWKFIKEAPDADVASAAAAIIREHKPQVMLVHFPDCDRVGHAIGWGTPQQVAALAKADQALGVVLKALEDEHLTDSTLVIVSADHGGNGLTHGGLDPRSRTIPWIAAGPGVRENYDLTRNKGLTVYTYDTFATACNVMGIPLPANCDGKPIFDIFGKKELLNAAP
ncbi:MAG TPA: alkaline phosphatase family protein [Tepidisphaeraceae bacterium]|jgi:predicted AlkP superfamily pyrophosphatase or phosphodiesterase|nr:alkaline phosphatase family protein [Tepidisphaeraceae bacterium]